MDYIWLDDDFLVAGIVVTDAPQSISAKRKNIKNIKTSHVKKKDLQLVQDSFSKIEYIHKNEFDKAKQSAISEYRASRIYEEDFLKDIREQVLKGLSFLHDYRQINSQISQHINVILEENYRGDASNNGDSTSDVTQLLSNATHSERAIYWASKFLEEKIATARFLLTPEFINDKGECKPFRLHGFVVKYNKIYQMQFEQKDVKVTIGGKNRKNVVANPEAVGVIPHTLLDNALKYAPKYSSVHIHFSEQEDGVHFSVESSGPVILEDEKEKIFHPFWRGVIAEKAVEEGAGYGLYLAQYIAINHLNTRINVTQSDVDGNKEYVKTLFEVFVPGRAPTCVGL
jgi:signal transduction histidine kinase